MSGSLLTGVIRVGSKPPSCLKCSQEGSCCLQVVMQSSEIGDERPVMAGAFSPDGNALATASWSGRLKLWRTHRCKKQLTVQAHDTRITGGSRCHMRHGLLAVSSVSHLLPHFRSCSMSPSSVHGLCHSSRPILSRLSDSLIGCFPRELYLCFDPIVNMSIECCCPALQVWHGTRMRSQAVSGKVSA